MAPHLNNDTLATDLAPGSLAPVKKTSYENGKTTGSSSSNALRALSQGVTLPGRPLFTDIEKSRYHMLEHMAGAFRVLARHGCVEGISGHISLRDPEDASVFWTNPLGLHFALLKPQDMILLDTEGQVVGGNTSHPANAAGFLIHRALHEARSDVNAACHFHSPHGKAWSAFAQPLEMINQDVTIFYGAAQAVYGDFEGIVLKDEESEALAKSLGREGKGMILRNHGLLTIQLAADAAAACGRQKVFIEDEAARYTFEMTSDPDSLYAEFQPYLQYESAMTAGGLPY
ncbi:hypothetical protein QQZ08_002941 [Neonectria magnoliae]|uniref:Class II aldolase/adducin N-terminal domain-containing protein n=1 Tax=Neonectria magnoliae TaxID=2732573 RepID=A0ABR1IA35_9HYPO